jgi:DNA (cytosine-5)-methyltransferase 1
VRPRLLDLFCGAGGAAVGYHRAGFDVVGVDLRPQPRYPFEFHQADAMTFPLDGFDVIHASPPCQRYSAITSFWAIRERHPDLIDPVRERLIASGIPYVIENVPGSPLHSPVQLCGSSFGMRVRRHRWFESNVALFPSRCDHAWQDADPIYEIRQHGRTMKTGVCYVFGGGQAGQPVATWRDAMGLPGLTVDELSQAIPPVYTEFIGKHLFDSLVAEVV